MGQSERTYRGVSAENRRADRRMRLVEAGLDILGEGGLANMTMTAVCARAGLTERYFYESFRNLDDLLVGVFDTFSAKAATKILDALDAAPPDLLARCRAAAGALIEVFIEDPRQARTFAEAIGSEALRDRRDASVRAYAELLADQMRELSGITAASQQPHLQLVTTMLVGGMAEAVTGWLDGTIAVTRDELVDDAARVAVAAAETLVRASPGMR
jgi:AcrR family transcriptional regulator